jgi:hypothetical protein
MSNYQLVKKSTSDRNILILERNKNTKGLRIVNVNRLTAEEHKYEYKPEQEESTHKIYVNCAELLGMSTKKGMGTGNAA